MSKLVIKKIKKEKIFCEEFSDLAQTQNNTIEFSNKGIAVIYGPNGVGKTSLASVFNNDKGTEFIGEFDGIPIQSGEDGIFHIIADQNSRNIIKGETEDFLLGDNIRKEQDLQKEIDKEFLNIRENKLSLMLKTDFNISKKTSSLINQIKDIKLREYISYLANVRSKGKEIDINEFVEKIGQLQEQKIEEFEKEKLQYLIVDYENPDSIIKRVLSVNDSMLCKDEHIKEIDENDQAISILTRYSYKQECIVCDSPIDSAKLLEKKKSNRQYIFKSLDDKTKKILQDIIDSISGNDPFSIAQTFAEAIETGDKSKVFDLQTDIKFYFNIVNVLINNVFVKCLDGSNLRNILTEYNSMIKQKLEMTDDDILYIEDILNDNIDKKISLCRDSTTKDIKLLLGNDEFLNKDRSQLHLSTGEQNFISLCFELLKAKNSNKKIVVLDDPISSFDSIYKNKIAYAIIKFLADKNQLILTHNIDLIRLLECQCSNCFNLYLFNNVESELNGFIRVSKNEKNILLYIDKLLNLFRKDIFNEILDEKLFLISMIPFMRGYAQLIDDGKAKEKLTFLMHGYKNEIENISEIYRGLFKVSTEIKNDYNISVSDILSIDIEHLQILKSNDYPLLNRTLKHSLTYLYLRLSVENVLVRAYNIKTEHCELLGQIINKSFEDPSEQKKRIYFTSRKTLLNEFNHFEGNMNIFQPAIDISDAALKKEKDGILKLLNNIKAEKGI